MRASFFGLGVSLALAGLSSAIPAESRHNHMGLHMLSARAVTASPDNTCGNSGAGVNLGYTCNVTLGNAGGCCSTSGWCGSTTDYCGSGCQTAFGVCNAEAPVTNTYLCGSANGALACTGGLCCSGAGYCGNTTDYCLASNGCQSAYGACNADAAPSPNSGTCGPQNGNAVCPGGQCCSVSGFCGTTEDFCSDPNNCAPGFGVCDSDTTPAGPSTQSVPRPLLGSVTYDDDVSDCVSNKVVALSFDDGPYLYTADLLDLLKTYGFTATFFITGNNNGRGAIDTTAPYPSVIQRMIAEGHQVASHTWSHYSLDNSSQALRISQMVKNEMALNNIIGKFPTYMRPPYSQCATAGCQADMKALGYHRVYFDLDTQDYLNPLPTQIQNSKNIVTAALKVAGVTDYLSIQHDIVQQSVANLSSFYFDTIKAKGWKGVTVGECLGDPQTNWYRTIAGSATTSTTSVAGSATTSVPVKVATSTTSSAPAVTTTATAPVSKCDSTIGKFCGKINTFTTAATCTQAVSPCNAGYMTCVSQGWSYIVKCLAWTQKCSDLSTYCKKCGKTCSNAGFGLSTLG